MGQSPGMSLDDAMNGGHTVSRAEAVNEFHEHGLTEAHLCDELGDKPQYDAREVLEWLGH